MAPTPGEAMYVSATGDGLTALDISDPPPEIAFMNCPSAPGCDH